MERYSRRQVNRALAQEQLLLRMDQGEDFETLCQELGLGHSRDYLSQLRRRYRQGGSTWEALIDRRQGHASKVTPERRAWLREQKRQYPAWTQTQLAQHFSDRFQVSISQSQVSEILRQEGVALPGGQPDPVPQEFPLERAGVFFPPSRDLADGSAGASDPGGVGAARRL